MRTPLGLIGAVVISFVAGCTADKCDRPAPLTGQRSADQDRYGYFVKFHDGVDGEVEAMRLRDSYMLMLRAVLFTGTSPADFIAEGFIANFDDDVRDSLRCEPSVASVSYDSRIP